MKKSVFSVIIMMAVFAISSVFTSCGDDKTSDDVLTSKDKETATAEVKRIEKKGFESASNFRYLDIDSVLANYNYAIQETKKLEDESLALQQLQNSYASQIQKKQNDIQNKTNNNIYMTQQSYESDVQEYQNLVQTAEAAYNKKAQELSNKMMQVQEKIMITIENYVTKYNETRQYDAILYKNAGVFFNPSLDITKEIIDGLNAESSAATTKDAK